MSLHVCLISSDYYGAFFRLDDLLEPSKDTLEAGRLGHVENEKNGVQFLKVIFGKFHIPFLTCGIPDYNVDWLFVNKHLKLELIDPDRRVAGFAVEFVAVDESLNQRSLTDI